ncbi:hypothetical protein SMUE_22500 [Enterococcus cecorum]
MFQYKGIRIRNRHKYASERFIFYLILPIAGSVANEWIFFSLLYNDHMGMVLYLLDNRIWFSWSICVYVFVFLLL